MLISTSEIRRDASFVTTAPEVRRDASFLSIQPLRGQRPDFSRFEYQRLARRDQFFVHQRPDATPFFVHQRPGTTRLFRPRCPENTYRQGVEELRCQPCVPFSASPEGASGCYRCLDGYYRVPFQVTTEKGVESNVPCENFTHLDPEFFAACCRSCDAIDGTRDCTNGTTLADLPVKRNYWPAAGGEPTVAGAFEIRMFFGCNVVCFPEHPGELSATFESSQARHRARRRDLPLLLQTELRGVARRREQLGQRPVS